MNDKRYRLTDNGSQEVSDEKPSEQQEEFAENKIEFIREKSILSYIQMVIGLIEGRYVSMDEVLKMLQKISRTHGIDRRKRFVYAFAYPRQRPP